MDIFSINSLIDNAWQQYGIDDLKRVFFAIVALISSLLYILDDKIDQHIKSLNSDDYNNITSVLTGTIGNFITIMEDATPQFFKKCWKYVLVFSLIFSILQFSVIDPNLEPLIDSHIVSPLNSYIVTPLFAYLNIGQTLNNDENPAQIRTISFDLGNGLRKLSKSGTECDYLTDRLGNVLSTYSACYTTIVDSRKSGIINQEVKVDLRDFHGETPEGFIQIDINTFLNKTFKPDEEARVITDSVNKAKGAISVKKIFHINQLNGNKITVHQLYSPSKGYFNNKADLFAFMPDDQTIVTVICTPVSKTKKLIESLQIGDLP